MRCAYPAYAIFALLDPRGNALGDTRPGVGVQPVLLTGGLLFQCFGIQRKVGADAVRQRFHVARGQAINRVFKVVEDGQRGAGHGRAAGQAEAHGGTGGFLGVLVGEDDEPGAGQAAENFVFGQVVRVQFNSISQPQLVDQGDDALMLQGGNMGGMQAVEHEQAQFRLFAVQPGEGVEQFGQAFVR